MTRIKAKGNTFIGRQQVEVSGDKMVRQVKCADVVFEKYIRLAIKRQRGQMANAYHPPANSMLQAFALLTELFGDKNVTVEGELEPMESKPGRIY